MISEDPSRAEPDTAHPSHSPLTRVIHFALLLLVLHQLIGNKFFMTRLPPGEPMGWPRWLHEYLGLFGIAVVGAFWIWALVRHGDTRLRSLFPWFAGPSLRALVADVAGQLGRVARLRLPDEGSGALASAVHGLGLIIVTVMVVSGTVFFFAPPAVSHPAMGVHKLFANLMWAYLIFHAGVALAHHLLGSNIFSRMFLPSRRGGPRVETA